MALQKTLHGLSVYVNGIDYVGVAESFTPPTIALGVEESDSPGHGGAFDIETGRLEALEAVFVMGDSIPELESLVGSPDAPSTPVEFVEVTTDGALNRAVVHEIAGVWRSQEASETGGADGRPMRTYTISTRRYTHRIDGTEVRHIDLEQAIHRIDGTDVNAERRAMLRRGR